MEACENYSHYTRKLVRTIAFTPWKLDVRTITITPWKLVRIMTITPWI
jgi:hypothetical protein